MSYLAKLHKKRRKFSQKNQTILNMCKFEKKDEIYCTITNGYILFFM